MIRQAISCDVCGVDKQQTNHWFIARQHADELRITPCNPRNRSRAGVKHLCGQTCLHKLLDEFLARSLDSHASTAQLPAAQLKSPWAAPESLAPRSASLSTPTAHPAPRHVTPIAESYPDECDSSARLLPISEEDPSVLSPLLPASITSRPAHADAWTREQARIQSEAQSHPSRRRSIA